MSRSRQSRRAWLRGGFLEGLAEALTGPPAEEAPEERGSDASAAPDAPDAGRSSRAEPSGEDARRPRAARGASRAPSSSADRAAAHRDAGAEAPSPPGVRKTGPPPWMVRPAEPTPRRQDGAALRGPTVPGVRAPPRWDARAVGPGAAPRRPPGEGVFAIDPGKCIAWDSAPAGAGDQRPSARAGTTCTTCLERCPLDGAVVFDRRGPRIDPEVCDGCGLCVPGCPAPVLAIRWRGRP